MNPPCHEIEILLTEYAAGDLDPQRNQAVRRHLAECADCRAELGRELRLRQLMGSLPVRHLPLGVGDLDPDARTRPVSGGGSFLRRWLAPAAGLAAVLVLVLLAGRSGPDTAPSTGLPGAASPAAVAATPGTWSEQELDRAQDELEFTLALTARLLQRSEKTTVHEVFGDRLPRMISESLRKSMTLNEGDQG